VGRPCGREPNDWEEGEEGWDPDEEYWEPEFDRDAEDVLWTSDLLPEDRERILKEARGRLARGETKEAVSDWLWRMVARTAFGTEGFFAIDDDGNPIDPPYVVKARKFIARQSGGQSARTNETPILTR
jgi:hypothetical protein